jgi:hypothetical protein
VILMTEGATLQIFGGWKIFRWLLCFLGVHFYNLLWCANLWFWLFVLLSSLWAKTLDVRIFSELQWKSNIIHVIWYVILCFVSFYELHYIFLHLGSINLGLSTSLLLWDI